jgi:hypothetical protein
MYFCVWRGYVFRGIRCSYHYVLLAYFTLLREDSRPVSSTCLVFASTLSVFKPDFLISYNEFFFSVGPKLASYSLISFEVGTTMEH